MLVEAKAQNIIITDLSNLQELRRYLNAEEKSVSKQVMALWERQRELVTIETVKRALQTGSVPPEWVDPWREMIVAFVSDDLVTEWVKSISVAGDKIARKINRIQRKQFDFDATWQSVKAWVDKEGGRLIVDLTSAQVGSIHALLQNQIALNVTSPYVLAQRIRPLVGLTKRETMAVAKFMTSLTEQGVSADVFNKQVQRYAKTLHKNRASRIARTELSNSYNFGQEDSLRQAREAGELPGDPEKTWMAGGADPCEKCTGNEGEGYIPLDDTFSSGHMRPTAHPQCECAGGYRVRR